MPQLPHEFHLLHDIPGNVFLLLVVELLDPDDGAPVAGSLAHVGKPPGLATHNAAQALPGGARVEPAVALQIHKNRDGFKF